MPVLIARKLCCCHCHDGGETVREGLIIVVFIIVMVIMVVIVMVAMLIILRRRRIRLAIPVAKGLRRTRLLRSYLTIGQLQLGSKPRGFGCCGTSGVKVGE